MLAKVRGDKLEQTSENPMILLKFLKRFREMMDHQKVSESNVSEIAELSKVTLKKTTLV